MIFKKDRLVGVLEEAIKGGYVTELLVSLDDDNLVLSIPILIELGFQPNKAIVVRASDKEEDMFERMLYSYHTSQGQKKFALFKLSTKFGFDYDMKCGYDDEEPPKRRSRD